MKIVIDIPKSIYEYMQTDKYDRHKTEYFEMIIPHSVKDGTPLEEEFNKIKDKISKLTRYYTTGNSHINLVSDNAVYRIIDKEISELKGENMEYCGDDVPKCGAKMEGENNE